MKFKTLLAGLMASAAFAASAVPVQWTVASGGNGHWYDFVLTATGAGMDWDTAMADSVTRSHLGQAGYLATITSMGEQDFIVGNVTGATAWLGGNDRDVEGSWTWVAGPEAGTVFYIAGAGAQPGFSFWSPGEPNDFASGEDEMVINWGAGGAWNDYGKPSFPEVSLGYIIEFADAPGTVPEPTGLLLAGAALLGVGASRRKSTR